MTAIRYNSDFRKKVLNDLKQVQNIAAIGRKYKITTGTIHSWITQEKERTNLTSNKSKYDGELKSRVIQELVNGRKPSDVARTYNIPDSTVHTWYTRDVLENNLKKLEEESTPMVINKILENVRQNEDDSILVKDSFQIPLNKEIKDFWVEVAKTKNISITQLFVDLLSKKALKIIGEIDKEVQEIKHRKISEVDLDL